MDYTMSTIGPAVRRASLKLYRETSRLSQQGLHTDAHLTAEVGSPVDTGKFRGSHQPSTGKSEFVNLPDAPSYAIGGTAVLGPVHRRQKQGESLFTTDAVRSDGQDESYAAILEEGGSGQAPGGVYGPAIASAHSRAAKTVRIAIKKAETLARANL